MTVSASESVIRFILDGAVVSVSHIDPSLTLLQYLRETLYRSGTKEGCAEGDCGACTVVLGELVDGRVSLRSVNACIQFVAMLHGKVLFTVESLKPKHDSELHPVQQAMVDCHGSQCGFCTSGFVMSLFALFKSSVNPDRSQINDALSGNLCRCTGYKPIIDAAQEMFAIETNQPRNWLTQAALNEPQPIDDFEKALIDQLEAIRPVKMLQLEHSEKQYFAPLDLQSLTKLIRDKPDATLIAGNTDVGLWVNKQLRDLPEVISLSLVEDLKKIDITDSDITIGAAVSLSDAFAALVKYYPELKELFRRFASQPVRNAGTLVGNVANGSPIGDSMPILIALQSELILRKADSQRIVALDQFYLGYQQKDCQPGEFIEAIRIPLNTKHYRLASYKVSKRYDQDISAVCAAFVIGLDEDGTIFHCRVAYGGMAATPARARNTGKVLLGSKWNEKNLALAMATLAEDFSPLSDVRASSDYRLKVAQNLLTRFYLETQPGQSGAVSQVNRLNDLPGLRHE